MADILTQEEIDDLLDVNELDLDREEDIFGDLEDDDVFERTLDHINNMMKKEIKPKKNIIVSIEQISEDDIKNLVLHLSKVCSKCTIDFNNFNNGDLNGTN